MIRCLHLADLHLGYVPSYLGAKSGPRAAERNDLLRKAVDVALEQQVDLAIIAGDLFDNHRPDSALVEMALRELSRLTDDGVTLITLPGNHDEITYTDSVYRRYAERWPGLLVTDPQPALVAQLQVGKETVFIYGVAYAGGITAADKPLTPFPRVQESGIHIGVFHGSLEWNTGERSLPLDKQALADAGYDYVALGHFHRFSQQQAGKTLIVYPGASEAKGYSDPGTGSVVVAEIANGTSRVQQKGLGLRQFREIDIAASQLADTIQRVANQDLALRVTLKGISEEPIDVDGLVGRYADKFYHLEVYDETEYMTQSMLDELSRELSIRGTYVKRMQRLIAEATNEAERQLRYRALQLGLMAFQEVRR